MTSRLTEIVENKRREVAERMEVADFRSGKALQHPDNRGAHFIGALSKQANGRPNLICELKPKSPSAGVLKADFNLDEILPHYIKEAAAISVLTDQKYFGGSLGLLAQVAGKTELPLLCKDFVVEEFQCGEAYDAGASAILLIVKILDDQKLASCHVEAIRCGLAPVVEVQNEDELARALVLEPKVILINNRNLDTFVMDMDTTSRLAALVPEQVTLIAASGYATGQDIASHRASAHNFLIGSSLMTAGDLASKLASLKGCAPDVQGGSG